MSGLKMNMRLFTNQSSMMQPKVQNNLINQLIVNNSGLQNVKLGCNVEEIMLHSISRRKNVVLVGKIIKKQLKDI